MKEHYGPEEILRRIFDEKGFEIGTESKGEKIVRCKDCIYCDDTDDKGLWCDYHGDWIEPLAYCYAAESGDT